MKKIMLLVFLLAGVLSVGCSSCATSKSHDTKEQDSVSVQTVQVAVEDSMAEIENERIKSPISAEDLLGLAEVVSK